MRHTLTALLGLLLAFALPAQAATLQRAHVLSDGRGYLFSFHFDAPISQRHFTLGAPHRLVVDLKGAGKGKGVADLALKGALDGTLVKGVRYGVHRGEDLRIVIDLAAPATYALGSLEGEGEVLRVTLTRAPGARFERRELPRVAPPAGPVEVPSAAPSSPPVEEPPLPDTAAGDLKCLKLVDGNENCEAVIDEVMEVTDNPYPNDAPPPPSATFEIERPEPKGEPQGSLGVHRFTKQTRSGKQRTDIGYKTHLGESELGVSLLRPSLTWEREAGAGDLRMLLRPDEFQLGYQMQWR